MNVEQFVSLVRQMRERQRAYFRQRRSRDIKANDTLIESKQLEKMVDEALAEFDVAHPQLPDETS